MATKRRRCKDCDKQGITTYRRIVPNSGGRCATHHRERRKQLKASRHAEHVQRTYGITADEYQRLYEHQGEACFICQRATGQRRKLAVDHDHDTGFVRGLLCKTCNYKVLGHLRDDTEAFARAIRYINNPPAFGVIGKRKVPDDD